MLFARQLFLATAPVAAVAAGMSQAAAAAQLRDNGFGVAEVATIIILGIFVGLLYSEWESMQTPTDKVTADPHRFTSDGHCKHELGFQRCWLRGSRPLQCHHRGCSARHGRLQGQGARKHAVRLGHQRFVKEALDADYDRGFRQRRKLDCLTRCYSHDGLGTAATGRHSLGFRKKRLYLTGR